MKAFLMHPDRDFDLHAALPPNEADLVKDLELDTLLQAMGGGQPFLHAIARRAVLTPLASPAEIVYRQHVLADCIAQAAVVRDLYQVAVTALAEDKKIFAWIFHDSPDTIVHRSREALELFTRTLRTLRDLAGAHAASFGSEGFTRMFAMLAGELSDGYLAEIQAHLSTLGFGGGILISARPGEGCKGTGHTLRGQGERRWRDRLPGQTKAGYTFYVAERDDAGMRALSELDSRGLNQTANALAQSVDSIRSFFQMLCVELGFYIGCLNLRDRLAAAGVPVCFPVPAAQVPGATTTARLSARSLRDPCLALTTGARVVGNDLAADGRQLIMVTGANQGGKSTFLRSAGLAQLMLQAGMFVAARSFTGSLCTGIFTHFKREEDAQMEQGKLDEELARMSVISGQVTAGGLLLCNESFASTNEREGSQIAREIIRAVTEAGIRVVFVTHLYDLAQHWYATHDPAALFLRAERQPDGGRTFRLLEGGPLPTSYGQDLYQQVFGAAYQTASA